MGSAPGAIDFFNPKASQTLANPPLHSERISGEAAFGRTRTLGGATYKARVLTNAATFQRRLF